MRGTIWSSLRQQERSSSHVITQLMDLNSSSTEYAPAPQFVEAVRFPRNIRSPNSTLRFDVITLIDGWMRIIDLCVVW
jgi:hypothetical protein